MINVLIVEDDPMARKLLEIFVSESDKYSIVHTIDSAAMAEIYCFKKIKGISPSEYRKNIIPSPPAFTTEKNRAQEICFPSWSPMTLNIGRSPLIFTISATEIIKRSACNTWTSSSKARTSSGFAAPRSTARIISTMPIIRHFTVFGIFEQKRRNHNI